MDETKAITLLLEKLVEIKDVLERDKIEDKLDFAISGNGFDVRLICTPIRSLTALKGVIGDRGDITQ